MIARFHGDEGFRRLVDALASQFPLRSDAGLAGRVAEACELRSYAAGEVLIEQDGADNDVFFILTGSVDVLVNGVLVASREAGCHVGEMAAIDPSSPRSAKVVAGARGAVVAVVGEPALTLLAGEFPDIWRSMAVELARRLRQRGSLVRAANQRPRVFVGSSVEGLPIARALQEQLEHDPVDVRVWTDNVFVPGSTTVAELAQTAQGSDFGVFVVRADDLTESRGQQAGSPRDNVILELGMFLGLHGQERALILRPRGADLKIPSDLLGITPLDYDAAKAEEDPISAIATPVNKLRRLIARLGPRT